MVFLDLTADLDGLYPDGEFRLDNWKEWTNKRFPALTDLCLADLDESLAKGLSWEEDYLPVLNGLIGKPETVNRIRTSFASVCTGLEEKIRKAFGRVPDALVCLYPGLCNGAGWVTEVNGQTAVLLGIEKIAELDWCGKDDMNGLIVHELGHVYQKQFGVLSRTFGRTEDAFLWQLFTEGVAMVFEQEVIGNPSYFHQDRNGWKDWCAKHVKEIASDFVKDLPKMTGANQRYFGDWVSYRGQPDAGYYLGAEFVRHAMEKTSFDQLIGWTVEEVRDAFAAFLQTL